MLWAVTSYFNPLRYRRRRENYREFRRRLGVPLVTVELGYSGLFDLSEPDADIVVRLEGRDVLWQKERLLNRALAALPSECDAVACIDCDVMFGRDDWMRDAAGLLGRYEIVQPFGTVHHLWQSWQRGTDLPGAVQLSQPGAVRIIASSDPAEVLGGVTVRTAGAPSLGFAWLYRRELIERHGLFDGCIVGGGDTAMACAGYGCIDTAVRLHCMNLQQERFYRAWAEPFSESVQGRVHWVEGDLYHLWHGRLEDRHPSRRHANLQPFAFDPYLDIALDSGGSWRWNSDKPQLHAYLRDYFASRKEDG